MTTQPQKDDPMEGLSIEARVAHHLGVAAQADLSEATMFYGDPDHGDLISMDHFVAELIADDITWAMLSARSSFGVVGQLHTFRKAR